MMAPLPEIRDIHIKDGVRLLYCRTDAFKTARMTISFAAPLDERTASGYSLLTNLLWLATAKHPSMKEFSRVKDELYALGLDSYVQRRGEILLVTLGLSVLADAYTFDGERLLFKAVGLLGDMIFDPCLDESGAFPESRVESEKANLADEIRSLIENKQGYAFKRARDILCAGEPFSADANGTEDGIRELDGRELYEIYYKKCLNELPVFITYVGEASKEYVLECIEAHLPFSPRAGKLPPPVEHVFGGRVASVTERLEMEECLPVLGLCCPMPRNARDRAVLSVFDELYGGGNTSRLFMNVREREGLCYYCASYPSGRKNVYFVQCAVAPRRVNAAIKAILRELEAVASGDFSDAELENAVRSVIRSLDTVGASLDSMTSYMLGQALLEDAELPGSIEANKRLLENVTREEITALAKRFRLELIYVLRG